MGVINLECRRSLTDMARKRYSKVAKIEPAVQTLVFSVPAGTGQGTTSYIDLSQVASIVNRRFYRQGINWAVAGFKFVGITSSGIISIQKLPNTWVMSNAWTKGFKAWQKMNREAMSEAESVRPKFLDFKIYADDDHHAAGFGANLLPQVGWFATPPANQYIPGEWEPSKIHVPFGPASPGNTTELELKATGANYNGGTTAVVSLIEGYAASRGLPNVIDPNTPTDADDASGSTPENWMSALFNSGTDQTSDVLEDMITENNIAPYPFEGDGTHIDTMYPGGANQAPGLQTHDYEFVTGTTIGGTTMLKGGNFPCGLIRIDAIAAEETTFQLILDLVPGSHRGYLCEPMTEM